MLDQRNALARGEGCVVTRTIVPKLRTAFRSKALSSNEIQHSLAAKSALGRLTCGRAERLIVYKTHAPATTTKSVQPIQPFSLTTVPVSRLSNANCFGRFLHRVPAPHRGAGSTT